MSEQSCNTCKYRSLAFFQPPCFGCKRYANFEPAEDEKGDWTRHMVGKPAICETQPLDGGAPQLKKENTGGSVSYYKVHIDKPISGGPEYDAECNDIVEALQMNFAEGNAFKAIWRSCAARGGLSKEKYSGSLYDAEKVVFFGKRMVVQATPTQDEGEKPC